MQFRPRSRVFDDAVAALLCDALGGFFRLIRLKRVLLTKNMDMGSNRDHANDHRKGGITMSTSFVYHAMGLSGYEYVHQKFESGSVTFRSGQNASMLSGLQIETGDQTGHVFSKAAQFAYWAQANPAVD